MKFVSFWLSARLLSGKFKIDIESISFRILKFPIFIYGEDLYDPSNCREDIPRKINETENSDWI